MKTLKKKLTHPFALVLQGFAAGALIFFATMSPEAEADAVRSADAAPIAETFA